MAFVNEAVSHEHKQRIASIITYEKVKSLSPWVPEFGDPYWWTIDRQRNVYLYFLTGGGPDQFPFYVLGIDGQLVVFNVQKKGIGDDAKGIHAHWIVHDLRYPSILKPCLDEIKQYITDGLREAAYCRPLAEGGSMNKPNMKVRGNILAFDVEFK